MTRFHPDKFFSYPATEAYAGFNKNNKPTEKTFKDLLDSLCFPERVSDAASLTASGLVRIASYNNVLNTAYSGSWPVVPLVSQLPSIIAAIGDHQAVNSFTVSGLKVSVYKETVKNKIDYLLSLDVKDSLEIHETKLRFVNDNATPGNDKYYGTNNSGIKGYHAIPTPSFTSPLSENAGVITINTVFSNNYTKVDFLLSTVSLGVLEFKGAEIETIRSIYPVTSAARIHLHMRAAHNSAGPGGNLYLFGGNGTGAVGGSVYIFSGSGSTNGGISIGYDPDVPQIRGRIGIGCEPDGTDLMKVAGTINSQKLKLSNALEVTNMAEIPETGRVLFLTTSGELGYTTYELAKSKLADQSPFKVESNVVKLKAAYTGVDFENISISTSNLKVTGIQFEEHSDTSIATVDSTGTIKKVTIATLQALLGITP